MTTSRAQFLRATVAGVAVACVVQAASAQSGQAWSVQASVLSASNAAGTYNASIGAQADGGTESGLGFEAQVRFTPRSAWSVGLGWQRSSRSFDLPASHYSGTFVLQGLFFEPRITIDLGSNRITPYLAGRAASISRIENGQSGDTASYKLTSKGFAFGGGGGLLVVLGARVNFDAGAAIVRSSFDVEGFGGTEGRQSFTGYVAKAGLSVGLGR